MNAIELLRNTTTALLMTIVTTLLLGGAYPLVVTAIAQMLFPDQANGQLLHQNGRVIGSRLIGQRFEAAWYFHSRPSSAGGGYDATASGGSNLGPTSRQLIGTIKARVVAASADNPGVPVPVELVTASGSGLDPHLSPAAALFQVPRVARARGAGDSDLRALVEAHIEGRQLGFLGEPRVNVLTLNLALDERWPMRK